MSVSLLLSNLQVTGSNIIYNANLTGIGGTLIIQSGNYVLISGAGAGVTQIQLNSFSGFVTGISGYLNDQIIAAASDVNSVNGLSGNLFISGAGGIDVLNIGQIIYVSGKDWVTSGVLAQSGNSILSVVEQSGRQAWTAADNNAINLSGNLTQTGISLINRDNSISGELQRQLNLKVDNYGDIVSGTLIMSGSGVGIQFIPQTVPTYAEGLVYYDSDLHALSYFNTATGGSVHVGQENVVLVVNKLGTTLNAGQVVFISGAQGNRPTVGLAEGNTFRTASHVIGLVNDNILNNAEGYIVTQGIIEHLDTSAYPAGTFLYLSSTVPGGFTSGIAPPPNHPVELGVVIASHAQQGKILVNIEHGSHLSGAHDVLISNPSQNSLITWQSQSGRWENVSPVGAGNISIATGSGTLIFSGDTGAYINFATVVTTNLISGNLIQSGIQLMARDLLLSGWLATGIANTGQQSWTAANNNGINISGNLTVTGQTLINLITNSSGLFVPTGTIISYLTGVATGWDTGYYGFNYNFSSIPRVEVTMELNGTNTMYGFVISGRSTSGFYTLYTDTITETGIYLNVLAKN